MILIMLLGSNTVKLSITIVLIYVRVAYVNLIATGIVFNIRAMIWTIFSFLGPLKEINCKNKCYTGRGPTGLRARVRNRGRLENRSHMVLKTGFQDGGDRTRIFTHKIIILA